MTAIEHGLEMVRRAIDDTQVVGVAVQTLRNWQHRLDKVTVLDGVGRGELQNELRTVGELLGQIHDGDPAFRPVRENDVRARLDGLRTKLIALVGVRGLD